MVLPLEGTLVEKLRKIEALHAGTKVDGEREAARRAAERRVGAADRIARDSSSALVKRSAGFAAMPRMIARVRASGSSTPASVGGLGVIRSVASSAFCHGSPPVSIT